MGYKLPAESEFGGSVDEGIYKAKLVKYFGPKEGKWGHYIDFVFEITDDDDYAGTDISYTYCGVSSKKFKSCCAALNNGTYDEDADLDDYIGARVKIVVENVEKNDNIYSNITSVKPGGKAPTPRPKRKPVVDDDDFNVDDDDDLDI